MTREQYLSQRQQLMNEAKAFLDAGNIAKFNETKAKVEALDQQYEEAATAQASYAALEGGAVVPQGLRNLGGGMPQPQGVETGRRDIFASAEYNEAFMNYVCRREPMPERFRNAAASTTAANAGAVIPTTIIREIVRDLKERGVLFQQLRHTNVQGGVQIPILDLIPTATWVGEGASEDKELTAKNSVQFSYFGLECKLAQSLLASVVTIEEFQDLFVEMAIEAIMAAIEKGVFAGTGVNQMLGVAKDPRVTNVVTLNPTEMASYKGWKTKVFAKIKKRYQKGKFYMAQGTFEGYVDGMVDENGQPVGRVNYGTDGEPKLRFGGKDVETVEDDVLVPYGDAAADAVVAVYMNPKDYVFNSNMQMTVVHWTDNDTNQKKTKVILICDGKIADPNGVIIIKKGASAGQ